MHKPPCRILLEALRRTRLRCVRRGAHLCAGRVSGPGKRDRATLVPGQGSGYNGPGRQAQQDHENDWSEGRPQHE